MAAAVGSAGHPDFNIKIVRGLGGYPIAPGSATASGEAASSFSTPAPPGGARAHGDPRQNTPDDPEIGRTCTLAERCPPEAHPWLTVPTKVLSLASAACGLQQRDGTHATRRNPPGRTPTRPPENPNPGSDMKPPEFRADRLHHRGGQRRQPHAATAIASLGGGRPHRGSSSPPSPGAGTPPVDAAKTPPWRPAGRVEEADIYSRRPEPPLLSQHLPRLHDLRRRGPEEAAAGVPRCRCTDIPSRCSSRATPSSPSCATPSTSPRWAARCSSSGTTSRSW